MTKLIPAAAFSLRERAELELRDGDLLLLSANSAEGACADERHVGSKLEVRGHPNYSDLKKAFEGGLLDLEALESHLRYLRHLDDGNLPGFYNIDDIGVVQMLARDDQGNLVRRIAAAIPNHHALEIGIPVDIEVDVPVLALLAGRDPSDCVRFLTDLVRRAGNAVRFFGCNDRGLRSAVRLLREALALHADQQAADTDEGRDDHAGSQPEDFAHTRSVSNSGVRP